VVILSTAKELFVLEDLLKNISPPLGVGRKTVHIPTKISPTLRVVETNISPSKGSPLAPGSFPMAEKGKECR